MLPLLRAEVSFNTSAPRSQAAVSTRAPRLLVSAGGSSAVKAAPLWAPVLPVYELLSSDLKFKITNSCSCNTPQCSFYELPLHLKI